MPLWAFPLPAVAFCSIYVWVGIIMIRAGRFLGSAGIGLCPPTLKGESLEKVNIFLKMGYYERTLKEVGWTVLVSGLVVIVIAVAAMIYKALIS